MITYHITQMAIFMAISLPLILLARFIFHRISKHRIKCMNWFHEAGVILVFAVIAGIASQTIMPENNHYNFSLINLKPFNKFAEIKDAAGRYMIRYIVREVYGNILLFAPLGFLLPLVWKKQEKFWALLVSGISISLAIEVIQLALPMRATDIDDVILNTCGALIGYVIYIIVRKLSKNRTDRFKSTLKE